MDYIMIIGAKDWKGIKIKHPGILEVPEGKNVWQLKKKDVIRLAKKRSRGAISRALNNLLRWNKNKRTKSANRIRAWARKSLGWLEKEYATSSVSKEILACLKG